MLKKSVNSILGHDAGKVRRYALLCSAAAIAISGTTMPRLAHAQQSLALEEITVTARKTAESLISVPLAVTAITAKDLEDRGMVDPILALQDFVPGFSYDNAVLQRNDRGYREFAMRGMEPNTPGPGRQTVGIFVDGLAVAGGNTEGFTNFERVEVIKGPQSAYFGRATFAGAINYITRDPSMNWGGQVNVNVGEFGFTEITGSFEGPIARDKLAFRLGVRSYHTDGQYSNLEIPGQKVGQRDTKSISATLLATPNDNLKIKAIFSTWKDEDGIPANSYLSSNYFNCNGGAGVGGAKNYVCGPISEAPDATRQWNTIASPFALQTVTNQIGPGTNILGDPGFLQHFGLKRHALQAHATIDYSLPDNYSLTVAGAHHVNKWSIMFDSSFRDTRDATKFPNPNYATNPNLLPYNYRVVYGPEYDVDNSLEFRLTSPQDQRLKWMAGANYYYAWTHQATNAFGLTGYSQIGPHNKTRAHTVGLFASAAYKIVDKLTLSVEGRYQWDKLRSEVASGLNLVGNPTNIVAQGTFKSFTPRAILSYEFSPDQNVYVSYAVGKRPGEFNTSFYALAPALQAQVAAVSPVTAVVPEEKVWFVELGMKGMFFNDRLRVLADVYYGDWPNRHIPNNIPTFTPTGALQQIVLITSPGGIVHLTGGELELSYKVTPELTLEGTLAVSGTKIIYTFSSDAQAISGNPRPTGTQLPFYAKTHASISATYSRPITSDINGYIRADYFYQGRVYESEGNYAWLVPTNKINLRAGVERGDYSLEVYGTNITDNRVPTNMQKSTDSIIGGNAITLALADKAAYGIRLSAKF